MRYKFSIASCPSVKKSVLDFPISELMRSSLTAPPPPSLREHSLV